jgi:phosphatidate cytidylyltransferase
VGGVFGAFTFDGEGTPKDRLLTALIILLVAYALSLAAVYLPYGRLIAVAWGFSIVGMSCLEVARLLARDPVTTRYLPLRGTGYFLTLLLPAVAVTICAIEWIDSGVLQLDRAYVAIAVSAVLTMVSQVWIGRGDLALASREGERFSPAFILVSLCGSQLIPVAAQERGIQILWWVIGTVAINDAAAYFIGRQFGKHKMAPALSPNKSIEGSIAGIFFGLLFGFFMWDILVKIPLTVFSLIAMTACVTVSAQAADLSKSYLKRLCGVKDTGAFFPGHGGVLDRFDGAIGAAPVVFFWIFFL